ncbi:methyltransferase [Motilimonas pumila]|uniref:Methyltransferase n=1 Tax=Motilimonas pumila TaxID=2303987 RepID=A0A418YH30_9GAMM|nr:methyltransferase [Motilimonas pumila]
MLQHFQWPAGHELTRLFHGRGAQFLDYRFINVDWLSPAALIILYSEVERDWLLELATAVKARLGDDCQSVQVQYRNRHMAPYELLLGEQLDEVIAQEAGLKYQLRLGRNQNYGLFLDMANGREWVAQHANNANVLNLFAYTCGFSVAAVAGGARQVVNVDMSKSSLGTGRDNHRLNQHDMTKVKFLGHDIFKSWGKLKKLGPYDLLIADPPSLQKGSVNIVRDYPKIMRRLSELVSAQGHALLCLNSPDLDVAFITQAMAEHAPDFSFVQQLQPSDIFINREPDKGLKVLLYRHG